MTELAKVYVEANEIRRVLQTIGASGIRNAFTKYEVMQMETEAQAGTMVAEMAGDFARIRVECDADEATGLLLTADFDDVGTFIETKNPVHVASLMREISVGFRLSIFAIPKHIVWNDKKFEAPYQARDKRFDLIVPSVSAVEPVSFELMEFGIGVSIMWGQGLDGLFDEHIKSLRSIFDKGQAQKKVN